MAKVVAPYGAAAVRGRVNGVIFNMTRGIQYVKKFTSPTQPRTARQLLVRGYVTTLSRAWAALTLAQRDGWISWADTHLIADWTGIPKRITGLNAYLKLNALRLDMGQAAVATAPVAAAPAALAALAAANGVGETVVTWTSPGGTATTADIWAQRLGSAVCTPTIVKAKHKAYVNAEAATYTLTGLTPGTWAVFARAVNEADGQVSTFTVDNATIT